MKEVHYYQCEYCGKTFEDEDECCRHELTEMVDSSKFQAYEDEKPVAWPWGGYEFEHINAICIENAIAWDFLNDYIQYNLGYCSPMEGMPLPDSWPVALFNSDGDLWINIEEEFYKIKTLKEKYLDNSPKV